MRPIDADVLTEIINKGIEKSENDLFVEVMTSFRDDIIGKMPTIEVGRKE